MTRAIFLLSLLSIVLGACTQRMVCPAYQSAFIYDKDELRKKFSYFRQDTLPKVYAASKTKYLIAEPVSYQRKIRTMQTVTAKPVYVHVPDSLTEQPKDSVITADLNRAALSVIDSTMAVDAPKRDSTATAEDSVYVISKDRELRMLRYNMPDSLEYDSASNKFVAQKPEYFVYQIGFNTEQDSYMWYLRHTLVLPDVRLAKMQNSARGSGSKQPREKGLKGFFKGLFGKKQRETVETDSAELEIPAEEKEFDFIDTTASEEITPDLRPNNQSQTKNKKPKRNKKKVTKTDQPKDPKKKEEEEDDGF